MLALALIVWQALGLPEVEDPIPHKIGFSVLMSFAGAGGLLGGAFSVRWPQRREWLISVGTVVGLSIGSGFYALSFVAQLLFGS